MEMIDILKATVQKAASDLHFVIGLPPMIRIDGDLQPMKEFAVLTAEESGAHLQPAVRPPARTV